jgi:hypothetical protein
MARSHLSTQEVNARIAPRGIKLKNHWKGSNQKNTFICSQNHEWLTFVLCVVNNGHGCPHCAGVAPLTAAQVNTSLKNRGIMLVGEWRGAQRKNTFRCVQKHTWSASGNNVLNKNDNCPHCWNERRRKKP